MSSHCSPEHLGELSCALTYGLIFWLLLRSKHQLFLNFNTGLLQKVFTLNQTFRTLARRASGHFLKCMLPMFFCNAWTTQSAIAQVYVSNVAALINSDKTRIEAYRVLEFEYDHFKPGDRLTVKVAPEALGKASWTIRVIDEVNFKRKQQGLGYVEATESGFAPTLNFAAMNSGKQHIFVYNTSPRSARLIYTILGLRRISPKSADAMKSLLEARYDVTKLAFEFGNFDIRVVTCGEANAFSSPNIVICSELVSQLMSTDRDDALWPIFYHELAHTLLRLWHDNRYASEDAADQLGMALGLLLDTDEKRNLNTLIDWLSDTDTTNEYLNKALFGDDHPFSIDRIKSIYENALDPSQNEVLLDWMKYLVPHMSQRMLTFLSNSDRSPLRKNATNELNRRGHR